MQANSSLVLLFLAFLLFHTISRRLGISRSRSRLRNEHGCQSPRRYPHSEPILGLDYFFRSVKAFSQKKLLVQHEFDFARLGPTFVINNIGNDRIVTKDPQNIQAILKGGLDEWGIESLRRLSMEPFSGEKSFFIRDDAVLWRTSRNQIKPALAKAEFGKFQDLEIYVARFLDLCPKTGETVDISSLFERLVQDYMSSYIFGQSVNSITLAETHDQKRLSAAFKTASTGVFKRTQAEAAVGKTVLKLLPQSKEFVDACATADEFINGCIDKAAARVSSKEIPKNYNDDLMQAGTHLALVELFASTQDKDYLRGLLTTLYTGATDSTASLLSNIVFCVSRAPSVLVKLRDEISALDNKAPDFAAIQKLVYLRAVIQETLRLYPIAPMTARVALKDIVLPSGGGPSSKAPILVKQGTIAVVVFAAVLNDRSVWGADAAEFRPERFIDMDSANGQAAPWTFTPFGGGLRVCPAQQFALATVGYVITRMLQTFKGFESRDDRDYIPWIRLSTSNYNGYHVALVPDEPR